MTRMPTTSILRRSLALAAVATAVAAPAADARLDPDLRADRAILGAQSGVSDTGLLSHDDKVRSDGYRYSDGVLRRVDGTPLSSPVAQADPRFRSIDGVVRAVDGPPLSALVAEPREASPAPSPSTLDLRDAVYGLLAGLAAALLLGGALLVGRSRGTARLAHP